MHIPARPRCRHAQRANSSAHRPGFGIQRVFERSIRKRPAFLTANTLVLVTAVAYLAAALLGLQLDAVSGFASLVWPASGIALGALLLAGNRVWAGIAVAAFTANLIAGAPVLACIGIAFGNTAAALIGAELLRKVKGFDTSLERVRGVVALVLVSVGSTLVSATVGVSVLAAFALVEAGQGLETWRAWWVGDTIGDLVMAPVLLLWAGWRRIELEQKRIIEALGVGALGVAVTLLVFGAPQPAAGLIHGREYMLFPPLMWAALRFGIRGSVTATFVVMIVAVVRTAGGHGPFVSPDLHQSLFQLQAFMGISGATFLLLGASISERRRAAKDLVAARETAEAANRAKAGFLAAVSHELRTPLNAITGYVDLLSLELDGPLTPGQHASLGRISDSQRHLLRLIDDVLGFAQIEVGRLSLNLERVIVSDVMSSVEPLVTPEMTRKALTFRIEPCDPSLSVHADPDKLRQVLVNLVTNAAKFTDKAGKVEIGATADGDNIRMCVSDTGIGIPPQHLSNVFDPFFQVDQGATRRYPGVGLGLSIVREIVLAMQGDVAIDSAVGKGTKVYVVLPRGMS